MVPVGFDSLNDSAGTSTVSKTDRGSWWSKGEDDLDLDVVLCVKKTLVVGWKSEGEMARSAAAE